MDDDILLSIKEIKKTYLLKEKPFDRLSKTLANFLYKKGSNNFRANSKVEALKGIAFSLKKGESIGVIGRNGSGKSTLLQILAGTLQASSGEKIVKGRVGAILELGSGFHPDFTGNENLKMAMSLLGVSRKEAKDLVPEIIKFSELEHAMEQPLKTYSQGMILRLAFAIQTSIKPDILLVDEALSVGDVFFQQKCAERVEALQKQGTAFVLVSHDTGAIRHYCQKALFLHEGKQVFCGEVLKAIHYYHRLNGKEELTELEIIEQEEGVDKYVTTPESDKAFWINGDQSVLADEMVRITKICILNSKGIPTWFCEMGEKIRVQIHFIANPEHTFNCALRMKNRYGQFIFGMGSKKGGLEQVRADSSKGVTIEFELECAFQPGEYTFCFKVSESKESRGERSLIGHYFETPWLGPFQIRWNSTKEDIPFQGMFGANCRCCLLEEEHSKS